MPVTPAPPHTFLPIGVAPSELSTDPSGKDTLSSRHATQRRPISRPVVRTITTSYDRPSPPGPRRALGLPSDTAANASANNDPGTVPVDQHFAEPPCQRQPLPGDRGWFPSGDRPLPVAAFVGWTSGDRLVAFPRSDG
jgi:hypothetical protein